MSLLTRTPPGAGANEPRKPFGDKYKWTVLSNTTLGMFMATLDASIVLIALPAIFNGIRLDPLAPANVSYLLWLLMGYLVVTAVLVVTFGKLGDMFGRVRMYNAGFAVFTVASIALSLTPGHGGSAAMYMIVIRVVQGIGGSLLMANSTAILTDAFPVEQRGTALGISMIAGISGSFIGLVLGGILADLNWRLVFIVNVPFGVFGTVWAYMKLKEVSRAVRGRIDVWGNVTFGLGLILVLVGITYGIQPYKHDSMGWTGPWVLLELLSGAALLGAFLMIETHLEDPMFRLDLFKIRAFSMGNLANLLSSIGRGGLQFMLIIWLQGIWLPQHGYNYTDTPLWAGIYMLPITVGFLLSAPVSGYLSDKYGARSFATGGMLIGGSSFVFLELLPANFGYPIFAALLLLNGIGFGLFAAPNSTAIMNSVPANQRGAASGMNATFRNSGMVLSIGLFFSLMIAGLASTLPKATYTGLIGQGLDPTDAARISHLPPVALLFAAFLGYNPMKSLLGTKLNTLSAAAQRNVIGRSFFPHLISGPFMHGLRIAFTASLVLCLIAAACSWSRGTRYVASDDEGASLSGVHTRADGADRPALDGLPGETDDGAGETPQLPPEWMPA